MIGSVVGSRFGAVLSSFTNVGSDFGAFPGTMLVALLGDSDQVGFGVANSADTGFLVNTPDNRIQYNDHYANSTNTPIPFLEYPAYHVLGPLAPYADPNSQSLGQSITFGQEAIKLTPAPVVVQVALTGSTLATHWLPTGTYPGAGSLNLYNTVVADIHQFETQVGRKLDAVVVNLGTNDAVTSGDATAFQANMTAFAAALRVDFGASLKIAWVKCNPNVPNTFISTVITAQQNVDTADAQMTLVDYDDLPLSGSFHATTNGYLSMGQGSYFRVNDLLGIARVNVVTTPAVVGYGPVVSGTGNLVAIPWRGERDGDLEVLCVVTGLATSAITTPAGWTLVQVSGDATAIGVHENMSVYTRPVTQALLNANNNHMPSTSITIGTSTRNAAKIFTVRGPNLNPTADTGPQGTASNAIGTGPVAITGVTTTTTNELVMCFSGGYCGSDGTMVVTNGGLTSVTEIQDTVENINTDREIINLTVGTKATAGATGNFSATSNLNMILVAVVLAIKP